MSTIGERIKRIMEECDFSYGKLSELTNIPKSNLQRYVTGNTSKIPMDAVEKIETALHLSKGTLMGWKEPLRETNNARIMVCESSAPYNPIIHKIPILGHISAGLPLYAEEHIEGYTYTEHNGGAEYFALKVKGDSMSAARINDGDLVIVRKQDVVENGEIAVVRIDKENATVKRFKKDGNIVQLIPQSFNPQHDIQIYDLKNTKIEVIGKVVECKIVF